MIDDFCDLGLTTCIGIWVYTYISWSEFSDSSLTWQKSDYYYVATLIQKEVNEEFRISVFLAFMVAFLWFRAILTLQLTETFGPILRILIVMFGDVLKFLFLWGIILFMMASVAALLFGELDPFKSFFDCLLKIFNTVMATYEIGDYDDLRIGADTGKLYIVLLSLINNVILLNFIVAILADTYTKFTENSLGLYYDGIISRIPIFEDDDRYGGLILGTPPFNVFAVLMIPFYVFVKDEERLRRGNDLFTKMIFAPIALMLTGIFMALTLVMVPFAYLAAIAKKIMLMRPKKRVSSEDDSSKLMQKVADLLLFIPIGIPFLFIAWLKDAGYFLRNTYRSDVREYGESTAREEHIITEP